MPFRRIAAVLGLGLACLIGVVLACTAAVTNPTPHAAALDRLSIPRSWTLADSNLVKNALLGSRIERYYLVDADPEQLVEPATRMLVAAGSPIRVHLYPSDWCTWVLVGDTPPPVTPNATVCPTRTIAPCWTNGPGGPTTCDLDAGGAGDQVRIDIFDRGQGINYFIGNENHIVRAAGLVVVRITDGY